MRKIYLVLKSELMSRSNVWALGSDELPSRSRGPSRSQRAPGRCPGPPRRPHRDPGGHFPFILLLRRTNLLQNASPRKGRWRGNCFWWLYPRKDEQGKRRLLSKTPVSYTTAWKCSVGEAGGCGRRWVKSPAPGEHTEATTGLHLVNFLSALGSSLKCHRGEPSPAQLPTCNPSLASWHTRSLPACT